MEFPPDCTFASAEHALEILQQITKEQDYAIIKQRSKNDKLGNLHKIWLMCDRSGAYKPANIIYRSSTQRINCPFRMLIQRGSGTQSDQWSYIYIDNQHNHPPLKSATVHPIHHRCIENIRITIQSLTDINTVLQRILQVLHD